MGDLNSSSVYQFSGVDIIIHLVSKKYFSNILLKLLSVCFRTTGSYWRKISLLWLKILNHDYMMIVCNWSNLMFSK